MGTIGKGNSMERTGRTVLAALAALLMLGAVLAMTVDMLLLAGVGFTAASLVIYLRGTRT